MAADRASAYPRWSQVLHNRTAWNHARFYRYLVEGRSMKRPLAATLFVLALSVNSVAVAQELHTFTRIQLNDQFWSEGASFGDLNNDGVNDIISGPWWWEGPTFKTRHEYYPATTTFQLKLGPMTAVTVPGFEGFLGKENKYSNNFFVLVLRLQHATAGTTSSSSGSRARTRRGSRIRRARTATGSATRSSIRPTTSRRRSPTSPATASPSWSASPRASTATPRRIGTIPRSRGRSTRSRRRTSTATSRTAWGSATSTATDGSTSWRRTAGGNSRRRSPAIRSGGFIPQPMGTGGSQMYAYDVNGDGLNDVITALSAHDFGLAWYEQYREGARDQVPRARHHEQGPEGERLRREVLRAPRHRPRRHGRRRPEGHRHRQALLVARPHGRSGPQ